MKILSFVVTIVVWLSVLVAVVAFIMSGDELSSFGKVAGVVAALAGVVMIVVLPSIEGSQRRRFADELVAAFRARKFVQTLELVAIARRRWPQWPDPEALAVISQIVLWRIADAEAHYESLWGRGLEPEAERLVIAMALFVAELSGTPDKWRDRADRARVPRERLALADFIQAARERDFVRVHQLHPKLGGLVPDALSPLVDAVRLLAMEESEPRPIAKVLLLGETGLEQVEKVWPDLADFIRRAPAK